MSGRLGGRLILLLSLAFALSCASPTPLGALGPGEHEITLDFAGSSRLYLVRVPPTAAETSGYPVVVAFHGGGGTPWQFRDSRDADELADREGVVWVHPAGTPARAGGRRLMTWNAGDCCGRASREDVDDVGFVAALLDDLAGRIPVDRRRIYATGHSNGGMMTMRVGAQLADRFAAIAPVGGVARMSAFPPKKALPVLHIHSVDDPRALFEGGVGPATGLTRRRNEFVGVLESLEAWRGASGCHVETREEQPRRWSAPDGSVHTATRVEWLGCKPEAPVTLLRLTGAGHGWPGGRVAMPRLVGPGTKVIDADEEAWAFFQQHRKAADSAP